MSDRAQEIIARGDPKEIIAMALGARFARDEGRFCDCESPSLHGFDLMCGNCLLENQEQIAKKTAHIRDPHPFEPRDKNPLMCDRCTMGMDHPRHAPSDKETTDGRD